MAMNALLSYSTFELFRRSIISSPLVIELPMEVVLLSSSTTLLHPTVNLATVQPRD